MIYEYYFSTILLEIGIAMYSIVNTEYFRIVYIVILTSNACY